MKRELEESKSERERLQTSTAPGCRRPAPLPGHQVEVKDRVLPFDSAAARAYATSSPADGRPGITFATRSRR